MDIKDAKCMTNFKEVILQFIMPKKKERERGKQVLNPLTSHYSIQTVSENTQTHQVQFITLIEQPNSCNQFGRKCVVARGEN